MWVEENVSQRALVGKTGSRARQAVSSSRAYAAALSLRLLVSNVRMAAESSSYAFRGSVQIRLHTGHGSVLYMSLSRNLVASSAS